MVQVFKKRLNYVGNDVDLWEMSKIYGEWLKYLTNNLNMQELTQRFWKMAKIFVKWLKYIGHVFEVRHRYVANDLNILNMAWMYGIRNDFIMLKMNSEFDKQLIYHGNDVCMWEMV